MYWCMISIKRHHDLREKLTKWALVPWLISMPACDSVVRVPCDRSMVFLLCRPPFLTHRSLFNQCKRMCSVPDHSFRCGAWIQSYFLLSFQALAWYSGSHDDVIKWKHFPQYRPFARGFHRSPVNSPHKGQWRGALMFSLVLRLTNGWVNITEAGDLRRYRAHCDVNVMKTCCCTAIYGDSVLVIYNQLWPWILSLLKPQTNVSILGGVSKTRMTS